MSGRTAQIVGYVRLSSDDQRTHRQDLGDVDRLFEDKVSGRDRLAEMLKYVRDGDTVRVHSMGRLARSLADLLSLVQEMTTDGVTVESVKERHLFRPVDRDTYAEFQMHVLAAVAQLERNLIKERQAEGIALAKACGVYTGRKRTLFAKQVAGARERIAAAVPKVVIAGGLRVDRSTLHNYIRATR